MGDPKRKSNDPSNTDLIALAREWIVKKARTVTDRVLTVVLLRPKTTVAFGLACVLAVVALHRSGKAVGEYHEKRHNEWRLRDIDARVRQADQRIREQMPSMDQEPSAELRGVFETMRDPAEPSAASESKP